MVFPDFAKLFMRSMMLMAMNESRPLVGSSQNRREGFVKNSDANDNLFFSPPDIKDLRVEDKQRFYSWGC